MKNLRKNICLAVIGIAFGLGIFVTTTNAQRSHWSFNVSIGTPYRAVYPRYYRTIRVPVVYRTRPVYYVPQSAYYNESAYYGPSARYLVSERSVNRARRYHCRGRLNW